MENIAKEYSEYANLVKDAVNFGRLVNDGTLTEYGDLGNISKSHGAMWHTALRTYRYAPSMLYPKIEEENGVWVLSVEKFNAHPAKRIDVCSFDEKPTLIRLKKGSASQYSAYYIL